MPGMRELWATGWMHNRVRMIVGSFLTKHLRVHWWHGARWFWDTLVDADLANNTLGWQWMAGTGADAAPYFRVFNPVTQAREVRPAGRVHRAAGCPSWRRCRCRRALPRGARPSCCATTPPDTPASPSWTWPRDAMRRWRRTAASVSGSRRRNERGSLLM